MRGIAGTIGVVCGLVALLGLVGQASAENERNCDYLIVTTENLAPALQVLADYRAQLGYSVELVTMSGILAETVPLEDDAATLRSYLAARHANSGTRFVLLGGDHELIPARFCHINYGGGYGTRDYPSDLYYACYEGTWNADGDSLYAEPADDPDLFATVAVGRAPVSNVAEAEIFVAKTLAYEHDESDFRSQALMAAAVMWPYPWNGDDTFMLDGAEFTEEFATRLGAPPFEMTSDRLYQNHTAYYNAGPLTVSSLTEALDLGRHSLVDLVAHARLDSVDLGSGVVTSADVAQLENGLAGPCVFAMHGLLAAFDLEGCFLVEGMVNPNGGFVAAVGTTALGYFSVLRLYQDLLPGALSSVESPRLGDVFLASQQSFYEYVFSQSSAFVLRTFALLGDPTLPLGPDNVVAIENPEMPDDAEYQPDMAAALVLDPCFPNPFNPRTTIAYRLRRSATVGVTVHDLHGRLIRTLVDEERQNSGRHAIDWNGLDHQSRAVPSAVYVYRVTADGQVRSGRMVLAR